MKKEVFKKDQLNNLLFGLRGRKEIPMKYEYLGKGAENWANLIKSKSYGIGLTETSLIKENLNKVFLDCPNVNLIDLGPGDGMKAVPIINFLKDKKKIASYCEIDISNEMLELAKSNVLKFTNYNKIVTKISDFEEKNFVSISKFLKKKYSPANFLLLLGNTVGNQFDRYRVLLDIRESMSLDDFLLVGLELRTSDDFSSIVEHYRVNEINKMITSNLDEVGIGKDSGKVEISFNKQLKQIEAWFVFHREVNLNFGGESLNFSKGEKILLMISYKAKVSEFEEILNSTGFLVKEFFLSKEKNYALVLCKPKPFSKLD